MASQPWSALMNSMIAAEDNPDAKSESPTSLDLVKRRSYALFAQPAPAAVLAASNDAAFDREQSTTAELAAWAQRASMANGFGEMGLDAPVPFAVSHADQQPARASCSASLREILAALIDALRHNARGWTGQWKQYQLQRATYDALCERDARALHDIGLTRSELRSVANELTGEVEPTRAHALVRLRSL
jgi:uncharacterized protein YjiS (DUF1127 family)